MDLRQRIIRLWKPIVGLVVFLCSLSFAQTAQAQTINEYIEQNNIQPNEIHQVNGTFDQKFGYRNGVGKPEGVVIHETADSNASAWDEVTYFNREWPNIQAYVHAFADANNILQIHSADYGVWGAGPWANSRMIQIELCEVNNYDDFARSVNNQAYFTAVMLKRYGLTPSLADERGYGTIWSHNAINQYHPSAGGHTDPIGYFNKWGYTMWQFYQLVQYHYGRLNDDNSANNTPVAEDNSDKGVIKVLDSLSATHLYKLGDDGVTMTWKPSRLVSGGSSWLTDKTTTYDGHTYYRVSSNEWVLDNQCTVTRAIPNK
ncbi:peptidoglycan recognition protein family protein [Bombilactobacillus bombi]|uniref:peptidoglycan recognition protein family protein n=1 Tax=Bombilactobacillus bombi TaxID=1303590 RepID=UPI0015E609DC|nr:peptidoglycan recognition family protein [Bombilactobacillus bombi]MBA1434288.1 N-acetylmuramoyl-L-alanine amidase [Bombilactobacillus bombi]